MPDIRKFERLVYILHLLQTRREVTTVKLAKECGVSIRTIYRDIDSLTRANVTLYYDRGYKLVSDYLLPRINFSDKEYRLLNTVLASSPLNQLAGVRTLLKGIQAKVDATVPQDMVEQNGLHNSRPRFLIHSEHMSHFVLQKFSIVENAILSRTIVTITHTQEKLSKKAVTVNPYLNSLVNGMFCFFGIESGKCNVIRIPYSQIHQCKVTNRKFKYRASDYDKILLSLDPVDSCSIECPSTVNPFGLPR